MPAATYVQPGEPVLLTHGRRSTYLVDYRPGGRFECHHGLVEFPEELAWGTVLKTNRDVPMAVLRPTHGEILTMLKRRTTVVYPKEAGRILMELGVRAGGRYGEVGSGSGGFASVLAAMVGAEGRVYSWERQPEHLEQAEKNARRAGVADRITFAQRDPEREGFDVEGLDGLFVDVPTPWGLVPAAVEALAGGAPWVSLSPTVDQSVRTEQALFDAGFIRRRMVETMEREWRVFPGRTRPSDRMVGHTAFLLSARRPLEPGNLPNERNR